MGFAVDFARASWLGGLALTLVVGCAPATPQAADARPTGADGGALSAQDGGAPERPFAGSATEATQLIGMAVDKKSDAVNACIREYRFRKHLAHERVEVQVGIDQEGHLLGVTLPKAGKDSKLTECIKEALKDAAFPRSHSGVISVTKTYEEIVE